MKRSLLIIKPGFIEHHDGIVKMLNEHGVNVLAEKTMVLNDDLINKHYAEHIGRPYFESLKEYMQRSEVVVIFAQGESDDLVADIRTLLGDKATPAPGTIRYVYGIGSTTENVMHASDSDASAERELNIFFPELV